MAGNTAGGHRAAAAIRAKYGNDFFQRIGSVGGKKSRNGGFASKVVGADGLTGPERAAKVGAVGGKISKRGSSNHDNNKWALTGDFRP